jgi:osmotically inducible protein OsmC
MRRAFWRIPSTKEVAMPVRRASAEWKGRLKDGKGKVKLGKIGVEADYSFRSRFEEGKGTNPEELIAAAHAGCFSMALAGVLEAEGYDPKWVRTSAEVELRDVGDNKFQIMHITLRTEAAVAGIDRETFMDIANKAKVGCPVSVALKAVEISLEAKLAEA